MHQTKQKTNETIHNQIYNKYHNFTNSNNYFTTLQKTNSNTPNSNHTPTLGGGSGMVGREATVLACAHREEGGVRIGLEKGVVKPFSEEQGFWARACKKKRDQFV